MPIETIEAVLSSEPHESLVILGDLAHAAEDKAGIIIFGREATIEMMVFSLKPALTSLTIDAFVKGFSPSDCGKAHTEAIKHMNAAIRNRFAVILSPLVSDPSLSTFYSLSPFVFFL